MGETPNRPVRNTHYSQPATEERQLYGAIGHIKHRGGADVLFRDK